jgi:hypothetical protein
MEVFKMTLEGSRKFWTMVLGLLVVWVLAKFGPTWGGVFETSIPVLTIVLGSVGYFVFNYIKKTTADVFVPDNWLAGKRNIIGLLLMFATPFLTSLTTENKDIITQTITYVADAAVPLFFMLFQTLSDKKMAAVTTIKDAGTATDAGGAPAMIPYIPTAGLPAPIIQTPAPVSTGVPQNTLKVQIATTRAALSASWEAVKSYLLGTFGARFEAALKRYANINMSTIEAARRAVMEVMEVQLDDKTCQAIGQIPGFLGALGAGLDVAKILPDLLSAIDRTPELVYMKTAFTKRAIWYAVKDACDAITVRCQTGKAEDAKAALQEAGMTLWEAEKSAPFMPFQMYYTTVKDPVTGAGVPGTYGYRDFSAALLAGVDPITMEDFK